MEQNRMQCLDCQQQIRPIDYAIHALAVHQTVAHVCAPCGRLFTNAADLAAHQHTEHSGLPCESVASAPPASLAAIVASASTLPPAAPQLRRRVVALRLPKAPRRQPAKVARVTPPVVAPLAVEACRLEIAPLLLPKPERRVAEPVVVAEPEPEPVPVKLSAVELERIEIARRKAEFEQRFGWSQAGTAAERARRQHRK